MMYLKPKPHLETVFQPTGICVNQRNVKPRKSSSNAEKGGTCPKIFELILARTKMLKSSV